MYIHKNNINSVNRLIDTILDDLPNDKSKKAYIIATNYNEVADNKIAEAIFGLMPYYRRFETKSPINALGNIRTNKDCYLGITFYKNGDKLLVTAGAVIHMDYFTIFKDNDREVKRLHIDLLQGVGGAGLILDLIKKIAEKKIKTPWLNKIKFDFMDLSAVASANTLDFYDHKGGLVEDEYISTFRDDTKTAIKLLPDYAIEEYKIIKKMPHKTQEQINEKNKFIYKFWDKYMRKYHSLIPYFFFYDTPASKKDKKEISKEWHKTQPKETLEKEMKSNHKI